MSAAPTRRWYNVAVSPRPAPADADGRRRSSTVARAALAALLLAGPGCRRARAPGDEAAVTGAGGAGGGARPAGVIAGSVIDSHVHLAYWPVADRLAAAGVGAAIDLAAPLADIGGDAPLTMRWAGPMITRPDGYPIDAWDPGGFGVGCADRACVEGAIAAAVARGAQVVKLAFGDDGLARDLAAVAVADAHRRGLPVAAHALDDAAARAAADAGWDLLAHTPVGPLTDATVAAWRGRAVISTLAAFGGGADAIANLRRLRAAGVTVLYGTDLGNARVAGVDGDELRLLAAAGLDGPAIVDAMTTAPAAYWHLAPLGAAEPGPDATFVILERDPRRDPSAYLAPVAVYRRGQRLR